MYVGKPAISNRVNDKTSYIGGPVNNNHTPVTYREGNLSVTERYNNNNQLIEIIRDEDSDGRPENTVSYGYDDLGRIIFEENITKKDGIKSKTITNYEYDKRGNMIKSTTDTGGDGTVDSSLEIEYDWRNRKTKETTYDLNGEIQDVQIHEYENIFQEFLSRIFG